MSVDENTIAYPELDPEVEEQQSEPSTKKVTSQPNDWNISTLREKYDRGQIDLQPKYQREYVWATKPELPSRLIESLLLEIPIPPLYFVRLENGKIEVVDGQQRLTSLINFVTNQFKLQRLQRLSQLNGKFFKDLTASEQERIGDATIRTIVIDAGTNYDLRYEIFERLNRGTMALNEQEIRNCVYRGPFCDLLGELEQDYFWRSIRGTENPESRFKEREMILRFFAFVNRIDHYGGNLKRFLNEYMGRHSPNAVDDINQFRKLFHDTMQNVFTVFGGSSARLYTLNDPQEYESGNWETKFSISALDIQASALVGRSLSKVERATDAIMESYKFYLTTNPQVRDAISRQPAGTEATKTRWFGFRAITHELLNTNEIAPTNDKLFQARILLKSDYYLAAGAVAGTVLEQRLKELCARPTPPLIPRGQAINSYNVALKQAGVFDEAQFLEVQIMANIRNRCSHAVTSVPDRTEVATLIKNVERFLSNHP
ncbi:MAG TPA: DUF262 domain-containing protein [Pyrinomonadaceae bacterium]|nr:DUF262 domain-containing protein [Pyrinomonadaceae bacterium]